MEKARRTYATPTLVIYGDVAEITQGLYSSGQPDLIFRADGRGHIVDGHKGHGDTSTGGGGDPGTGGVSFSH